MNSRIGVAFLVLLASRGARPAEVDPADVVYRWTGRVIAPHGSVGGRAEAVDAAGIVASAAVGSDGRFEIDCRPGPEGMRIRVSLTGCDPEFFDLPSGQRGGLSRLGERVAEAAPAGGVSMRVPPRAHVRVFEAGNGATLDARLELARGDADGEGRAFLPASRRGAVVVVAYADVFGAEVLSARLSPGTLDPLAESEFGFDASVATLEGEWIGARYSGYVELPVLAPLQASPYRLPISGVMRDLGVAGKKSAAVRLPAGSRFDGQVVKSDLQSALRLIGGAHGTPRGAGSRDAFDAVSLDASNGAALAAVLRFEGGDLPPSPRHSREPISATWRLEPAYDAVTLSVGIDGPSGSVREVRLPRRARVRGAVGGVGPKKGAVIWYRRDAGAVPTRIGAAGEDGLFGPFPIPSGRGEVFAETDGESSAPFVLEDVRPDGDVVLQLGLTPEASIGGIVRKDGRTPAAGIVVRLLPAPDDRRLLGELALPHRFRDETARMLVADPRARVAVTGDDGRFQFVRVKAGASVLVVEAPGRASQVTPLTTTEGAFDFEFVAEGADLAPPEAAAARPFALSTREPYGPEVGTFFGPADDEEPTVGGFRRIRREPSPIPDVDGERALHVRVAGVGRSGAPVLLHVWPEDASVGGETAFATAFIGGEAAAFRFRGEGRLVVRVAAEGLPWITFGPFETQPVAAPARPVRAILESCRDVVARVRTQDGGPAFDSEVEFRPERDRVIFGVAPPPLRGSVGSDGILRAPPLPPGRVLMTLRHRTGFRTTDLAAASDEVVGELILDRAPERAAEPFPSEGVRYFDADGRRLSVAEALSAFSAAEPIASEEPIRPEFGSRDAPSSALWVGPRPIGFAPDGRPYEFALFQYEPFAEARLVPGGDRGPVSGAPVIRSFVDRDGELRFPLVPDGFWTLVVSDRGGPRPSRFELRGDPRRRVRSAPDTGTVLFVPVPESGVAGLKDAKATLRLADVRGPFSSRGAKVRKADVLGDGQIIFEAPADEALFIDVVSESSRAAVRLRGGPFAARSRMDLGEVRVPPADDLAVTVRGGPSPWLPLPGATVGVRFVDGFWDADTTGAEGEAVIKLVPRGAAVVLVAAPGYEPQDVPFVFPGSGGVSSLNVDLVRSRPARIRLRRFSAFETYAVGEGAVFGPDPRSARFPASWAAAEGDPRPDRAGVMRFPLAEGASTRVRIEFGSVFGSESATELSIFAGSTGTAAPP